MSSNLKDEARLSKGQARYGDLMAGDVFNRLIGNEKGLGRIEAFANAVFEDAFVFRDFRPVEEGSTLLRHAPFKEMKFDMICTADDLQTVLMIELAKYKDKRFDARNVRRLGVVVANNKLAELNTRCNFFVSINIADFIVYDDHDDYLHIKDMALGEENRSTTAFIVKLTIELPKFMKSIDELETDLDKWIFLFKNLPYLESMPKEFNTRVFKGIFKDSLLPE